MQPTTWANIFRSKGYPIQLLRSTSCDTCVHDYPWIDETTRYIENADGVYLKMLHVQHIKEGWQNIC
jgi:hypothetical protein